MLLGRLPHIFTGFQIDAEARRMQSGRGHINAVSLDRRARVPPQADRELPGQLAGPGTRSYGVPSIVAGLHATTELVSTVPPSVFYPMPDVDSAVIVMSRIAAPAAAERAVEVAGSVFQQRRKMMRRSLAGLVADPAVVLAEAGVDPTARPEELLPEDFVRLAKAIA